LPPFLEEQPTRAQEYQEPTNDINTYFSEYQFLEEGAKTTMSYNDCCNLRMRNKPRMGQSQRNFDLLRKLGKMFISSFHESDRCTMREWVHTLDTYFQFNSMIETEEFKFSTIHLDGEAHEWWYHGLVMLGHANIRSHEDFTHRLMDQFDKKDMKIHFKELA